MSNYDGGFRLKCPSCGATYWYSSDNLDEEGSVECQNCAGRIFVDSMRPDSDFTHSDYEAILPSRETNQSSVEGMKIKCPNCQARYIYKQHQILENNTVQCQNCGMTIDAVGEDVFIYDEQIEKEGSIDGVLICLLLIIFLFVPWIIAIPVILCVICLRQTSKGNQRTVVPQSGKGLDPR